ncbi:Ig-like domain-containing protein [Chloroflexota bacterium]
MRKFIVFAVIIAVLASMAATVYAAPPPDGPPGLKRAIEVQEAHTDSLVAIPGVVGTAVGLQTDGEPVVKIYTESPGVVGLPKKLDGVPVLVQVTGKIVALGKPQNPGAKGGGGNKAPEADDQDVTTNAGDLVDILITGFDKNGCGDPPTNFTFSATSPTYGGSLDYYNGSMACNGKGYLSAQVQYTPKSGNDYFDSFTFTISDGEKASNIATVSITVGSPPSPPRYHRPAYIGTSSGSEQLINIDGQSFCTVGTLGVRLTDGTNVYALSNNHVYALEGIGAIDDRILQPGRVDMTDMACGSTDEINEAVIGNLAGYVPIIFSTTANNKVDAAVASTMVEMVGTSTPLETGYGTPSSTIAPAEVGMRVQKHGRTTSLTKGRVTGINATILVEYDSGIARFEGQIEVFGRGFSAGGDSGSLIVTTNGLNPVALLFAGGGFYTFGNPIGDVLSELSNELGGTLSIDGGP